jgi:SPP1 gp7 family putative phage head morphogenesis protein
MKIDPTKTLTLRRKASRKIGVRFNRLKRVIRSAFIPGGIMDNPGDPLKMLTNVSLFDRNSFNGLTDFAKVAQFDIFFHEQVESEVLRTAGMTTTEKNAEFHWLNEDIGEGYRRGAVKTRLAAERAIPNLVHLSDYSPLTSPFHADRAQLIFTKAFSDLDHVSKVMEKQISRTLADGILKGQNPVKVARAMVDRVDKIGITRARLISRTEIIESHNLASINEAEVLERETGVEIKMKWATAGDSRVRDEHIERDGIVYTRAEAKQLIGEPNCRCDISPVFEEPK